MKITKFGHSCLLIEEQGTRVLLDPGSFSSGQNDARDLNAILITHEHGDHLDLTSLKAVRKKNPDAVVLTNTGVARQLEKEGIPFELLEEGKKRQCRTISLDAYGKDHAIIYKTFPPVVNTGYFVGTRFFYPGDSFFVPPRPVAILALPATAPWAKISESIDYALRVRPGACIPVHDGILKVPEFFHRMIGGVLQEKGIRFISMTDNETLEL